MDNNNNHQTFLILNSHHFLNSLILYGLFYGLVESKNFGIKSAFHLPLSTKGPSSLAARFCHKIIYCYVRFNDCLYHIFILKDATMSRCPIPYFFPKNGYCAIVPLGFCLYIKQQLYNKNYVLTLNNRNCDSTRQLWNTCKQILFKQMQVLKRWHESLL